MSSFSRMQRAFTGRALSCLRQLGKVPSTELTRVLKCLEHSTGEFRRYALETLLNMVDSLDEEQRATVAKSLKDPEKEVIGAAAKLVGEMGAKAKPHATDLQAIAKDAKVGSECRRHAVEALGNIGRVDKSVNVLIDVLDDDDQNLRKCALKALKRVLNKNDKTALEGLAQRTKYKDVRDFAQIQLLELL